MSEKLFNKNFFLLFQGNLVSLFGDYLYELAIGFWVIMMTGSPVLMGLVMATPKLVRSICYPIGGVYADFLNRKTLLVISDLARGIAILIISFLAFTNQLTLEALIIGAIVIGLGDAFFWPTSSSIIPDLVQKKKIVSANAAIRGSNQIVNFGGNSIGGFLYQLLGAPFLFLINGLSYILSAISELFIKVPKKQKRKLEFFKELRIGVKTIVKDRALRHHLIFASMFNLFVFIGLVLFIPLFNKFYTPFDYGLVMGVSALGMFFGAVTMGFVKNTKKVFIASVLLQPIFYMSFALSTSLFFMAFFLFIGGFFNALINVIVAAGIQNYVKEEVRGKVISFAFLAASITMPIGMIIGGWLGEFFQLRLVIILAFFISWLVGIRFILSKELLKMMTIE